MAKFTVAIPTHAMTEREYFLGRCLDSLWSQSFQDFDIVISDNSDDDVLEKICQYYGGIKYVKNPIKGMAQNTNEAIRQSTGQLIKILYMDDYLAKTNTLKDIWNNFTGEWMICGSDNNHKPLWTEDILQGNNKLGSPSALTIKNGCPQLFDENLTWLLDVLYYSQLYKKFGDPVILKGGYIGIGRGTHQMTHLISDERKISELNYINK